MGGGDDAEPGGGGHMNNTVGEWQKWLNKAHPGYDIVYSPADDALAIYAGAEHVGTVGIRRLALGLSASAFMQAMANALTELITTHKRLKGLDALIVKTVAKTGLLYRRSVLPPLWARPRRTW